MVFIIFTALIVGVYVCVCVVTQFTNSINIYMISEVISIIELIHSVYLASMAL